MKENEVRIDLRSKKLAMLGIIFIHIVKSDALQPFRGHQFCATMVNSRLLSISCQPLYSLTLYLPASWIVFQAKATTTCLLEIGRAKDLLTAHIGGQNLGFQQIFNRSATDVPVQNNQVCPISWSIVKIGPPWKTIYGSSPHDTSKSKVESKIKNRHNRVNGTMIPILKH